MRGKDEIRSSELPDEDLSGGFSRAGWADPYWDDVMQQVGPQ